MMAWRCFRRRGDDADVPDAHHGEMQGPGDGGGGEGQHVHGGPQAFELFLVPNAEALLLVEDEQSQIGKGDILLKQPVGADDDVYGAFFDFFDDPALLGRDRKRLRQATFTG
jgi:hypothetical protein